jgi:head-tail adaptor
VEPTRGRQMLGSSTGAEKIIKEVTALIVMRWRSDIDATWRIVHETKAGRETYGIISIASPQSRQAMLELLCRRVDTGEPA